MIDKNKQYRTRDGREVRIYATDGGDGSIVHGAVKTGDLWLLTGWPIDGVMNNTSLSGLDLIEVKPRIQREVWVNVYPTDVTIHKDKQAADYMCGNSSRIACVKLTIDVEEGEGL